MNDEPDNEPSGHDTFAYFDGDDIGPRLELLLLDNKIEEARQYSLSINQALTQARTLLEDMHPVEVIIFGGDDLFVSWPDDKVALSDIENVKRVFLEMTGNTMSVGLGRSPKEAMHNLRRAKLLGKDKIVQPL
jgi:CRISPR/Cas system-associated protein Cas10 (large subunit of type III CRISPR-Cas system)